MQLLARREYGGNNLQSVHSGVRINRLFMVLYSKLGLLKKSFMRESSVLNHECTKKHEEVTNKWSCCFGSEALASPLSSARVWLGFDKKLAPIQMKARLKPHFQV